MDFLNEKREYQVAEKFLLHRFGKELILYDAFEEKDQVSLDMVKADVLLFFNELHCVGKVWKRTCEEYQMEEDDSQAQNAFKIIFNEFLDKNLLKEGKETKPVSGKENAYFPISITIELTDRCNLRCTHCYKEAQICNNSFLSLETIKKIFSQIDGNVGHIDISGGEATLHPDFEEIVKASPIKNMSLLTNGTNLNGISKEVLSKFTVVQVSMYGASPEEYEKYTTVSAYNQTIEGIKRLINLGISTSVAIYARKDNISGLGDYIETLSSIGVDDVFFGRAKKAGRNKNEASDWDLNEDDCKAFGAMLEKLRKAYPHISFGSFNWEEENTDALPEKDEYELACDAGKFKIVVTDKGKVLPCHFLPKEFFEKESWDFYYNLVSDGKMLDTKCCVMNCYETLKKAGQTLDSICPYAFK